jgi:hypothetical protein
VNSQLCMQPCLGRAPAAAVHSPAACVGLCPTRGASAADVQWAGWLQVVSMLAGRPLGCCSGYWAAKQCALCGACRPARRLGHGPVMPVTRHTIHGGSSPKSRTLLCMTAPRHPVPRVVLCLSALTAAVVPAAACASCRYSMGSPRVLQFPQLRPVPSPPHLVLHEPPDGARPICSRARRWGCE